jgi:hypothetical protein
MGDWAKKTLAKLSNDEERARIDAQRQTRIKAEAGYLWAALKDSLKEEVDEFRRTRPNQLVMDESGANKARIRSGTRTLDAEFDSAVPVVVYAAFNTADAYSKTQKRIPTQRLTFAVDEKDEGVWFRDKDGTQLSAPDAAAYLLDLLGF